MSARTYVAGFLTAALTGSALMLGAGSASAVTDADDPSFTPVAGDLIGVGSDTSQHAVHLLAASYNATSPAARIASFAATGGGTIALPSGDINRPNGSGAGKALLYGAGNNLDVDFARSSSAISTTEAQNGLQAFPFALDTLAMAVSNSTPSHAPASLTPAQIVSIYKGDVTNWTQVGGTAGTIAPKIPQAGSGTRSFFESQLKSMNGGVAVTLAASVAEVQEHDDTLIKNNPDAIAPFSTGRAGLLGTTLRIETGWKADRALYNVVRGTDLGNAAVQAAFGENGFLCSTSGRDEIEAAGFKQLATPARGGVCGAATQSATSNFTLNEAVATATSLTGTSPKARQATLVASVTAPTAPAGTVDFFEGDTLLMGNVPLVSGAATYVVTGATPGTHTYTAVYEPAEGSAFDASQASDEVLVRTSATLAETFPATVAAGKRTKGTVTVTLAGVTDAATGKVLVKLGRKTVGSGTLSGGKTVIRLASLPKGKNVLKATYGGNSQAAPASKKFTIKQQ